jgi:hypothetical protein
LAFAAQYCPHKAANTYSINLRRKIGACLSLDAGIHSSGGKLSAKTQSRVGECTKLQSLITDFIWYFSISTFEQ